MTAIEYAKGNGYETAVLIGKWHGMRVYRAIYMAEKVEEVSPGEISITEQNIGFPKFILQSGGSFRMADYDEAMTINHELG